MGGGVGRADDPLLFTDGDASNGDLHEVVKGKIFAFRGPTGKQKALGSGRFTLTPPDYFEIFRVKGIRTVVRLNEKEYDRNLVRAGKLLLYEASSY